MKKQDNNLSIRMASLLTTMPVLLMTSTSAANDILTSTVGQGLKNLMTDMGEYLMILSLILGPAACVYFLIRRTMADEQEGRQWNSRIRMAIICTVLGVVISSIIALIAGYFA